MKRIFLCAYILLPLCNYAMEKESPLDNKKSITISADPLIGSMPIEEFRNARSQNQEKKDLLFKKMQEAFPLSRAIQHIKSLNNPQIILWFSNYFGSVMEKTMDWYQENVFTKIPNGTFWLTDLKAWSLFVINKQQLQQIKKYSPIITKLNEVQKTKESGKKQALTLAECPFISESSAVLDKNNSLPKNYKIISSKEFFKWLLQFKDPSILDSDICKKLCKEYGNKDRLQFSLSDMGYNPKILDREIQRDTRKENMLEMDSSTIYRVLQYLEGIYYATTIIEQSAQEKQKDCSIIFMLPNKEFTYYMIPQEQNPFENFKNGVQAALSQTTKDQIQATIYFQPFAYGSDFYDTPYKFNGSSFKNKQSLIERLQKVSQ